MSRPAVIVLAGGVSNRLWPLRETLSLEFGSLSLLERHLQALRAAGCERFIVVCRPDTKDAVASLATAMGLRVDVAVQPEPRGMADAVLCARPILEAMGDAPVYVTQAHDVLDPALHGQLLDRWAGAPARWGGLIAAACTDRYFPGGYLKFDGERVTEVVEKPGAGNEPSDLVNLVAHVFASSRSLLEALTQAQADASADDAYERGLSRLVQAAEFRSFTYTGRWQALKYPWHLLDVMALLLDRWTHGQESPGPDYEQREDGVFVGRDVQVYPGAYIVAPALIGHGCVIGHNALVRDSLVGPQCVVGFGSEVARSYLAAAVELHHNYVGDSILDRDTALGYGAVTANYRLDEKTVPMFVGTERIDTGRTKLGLVLGAGARLGVNTSTMPGVKIGAGAIVGPNLRVSRDLPDGARYLTER